MRIDTAIILCGGKGSRFRKSAEAECVALEAVRNFKSYPPPRTSLPFELVEELRDTPKCLVPLCGKPLLWHKIHQIAQAGIQEIILCAGKNTAETRACVNRLSWEQAVSISYSPQGLFVSSDLSSILKSLKGRSEDKHVLITAGDCLTTTDYSHLVAKHVEGQKSLTIATRHTHGDRAFIQDTVASHSFLREASHHAHKNLSHYPHNSPLTAAVLTAWHNHDLLAVEITTDHINMNTISDYATLISDPGRFVPISAIGQPRLSELTPSIPLREHSLQP